MMNKEVKKYYGLYESDSYKFEGYTITLNCKEFKKTPSGKSWIKKPYKEYEEKINFDEYFMLISSGNYFKNLGGFERITKNYTVKGFLPTSILSISPCKTLKIVREVSIERI